MGHSNEEIEKQVRYLELLLEANKDINLTGITQPKEAVIKHTLDSLSASKAIEGSKIIDIGSGGGTPGIPLAIANPDKHFYLIDSVLKNKLFRRSNQGIGLEKYHGHMSKRRKNKQHLC